MEKKLVCISALLWVAAFPSSASADIRAANACAESLTAEQKLIYQSVLPDLKPDTDLPTLVRAKVTALVSAGRLQMSSAPDDAMVAGRCLRLVYQ